MSDAAVISVAGLAKRYGEIEAVRGVDFKVAAGEVFGFLGPNGAGKSTTIKMLCTLVEPAAGTALVAGHDVIRARDDVRRNIGLVFQDPTLDEYLSAEQNLRFHAELYGMPKALLPARSREVLEMVGLWERRAGLVSTYSGGMKRRLEIARGLLHSPRVLFLDEPTVGLDPQTRTTIWSYIEELRRREDITIFLTTHYMDEAEHCNRIGLMHGGKLVALDTPAALKHGTIAGDVLEVEGMPQDQTRDLVAGLPGVREVAPYGARLHAIVDDAALREPLIVSALQSAGIADARVERIEPSLEDVFVALVGEQTASA